MEMRSNSRNVKSVLQARNALGMSLFQLIVMMVNTHQRAPRIALIVHQGINAPTKTRSRLKSANLVHIPLANKAHALSALLDSAAILCLNSHAILEKYHF